MVTLLLFLGYMLWLADVVFAPYQERDASTRIIRFFMTNVWMIHKNIDAFSLSSSVPAVCPFVLRRALSAGNWQNSGWKRWSQFWGQASDAIHAGITFCSVNGNVLGFFTLTQRVSVIAGCYSWKSEDGEHRSSKCVPLHHQRHRVVGLLHSWSEFYVFVFIFV